MSETAQQRKLFHRLYNGRSEDIFASMPDGFVDLVLTDPPFGADNLSNMSTTDEGKSIARKIEGDGSFEEAEANFKSVMNVLLPKTKEHCDLYVFCNDMVLMEWLQLMRGWVEKEHEFYFKRTLIWRKGEDQGKQTPGMGDKESWGSGVEFILYAKKGRKPRYGDRRGAVIDCPKLPSSKIIHPHEKPLRLLRTLIEFSTEEGDVIADPYGGSGSTLRASFESNRSCISAEYDKVNHLRAVEKFEKMRNGLLL
jgi:DNA modification methylase